MEQLRSITITGDVELRLLLGDLTRSDAEAIVNAANGRLQHGAGVAGAIVRRGGEVIQIESDAWVQEHGPATHDRPALTSGGELACKAVIHVVGPRWGQGDEDHKLHRAVTAALQLAHEQGLNSIAFPAISTGIFGFPMDRAAAIMLASIDAFVTAGSAPPPWRIDLVLFDQAAADTFMRAIQKLWPGSTS